MILQQCKLNAVVFWVVSTIHISVVFWVVSTIHISVIQRCTESCCLHLHDTFLQNKFRRKWNTGKL